MTRHGTGWGNGKQLPIQFVIGRGGLGRGFRLSDGFQIGLRKVADSQHFAIEPLQPPIFVGRH